MGISWHILAQVCLAVNLHNTIGQVYAFLSSSVIFLIANLSVTTFIMYLHRSHRENHYCEFRSQIKTSINQSINQFWTFICDYVLANSIADISVRVGRQWIEHEMRMKEGGCNHVQVIYDNIPHVIRMPHSHRCNEAITNCIQNPEYTNPACAVGIGAWSGLLLE